MTAPNGYDTALKLLELSVPPLIIFLTNSLKYAVQGYGVAFRYITKPITLEKLYPVLDAAVRKIKANRLTFTIDGTTYILRMDDILFIEVYNHMTIVHTIDSKYSIRASLKEIIAKLPAGHFGTPHQSYVVNFSYVNSASAQEISLTNGVRIPISRRRREGFMRQLYLFLGH